jgi:hypothetical protein
MYTKVNIEVYLVYHLFVVELPVVFVVSVAAAAAVVVVEVDGVTKPDWLATEKIISFVPK